MNAASADMTKGNIVRHIMVFSLPLIAANTLQQIYGMVDTIILGMYSGIDSLAVLGTSSWIVWLIVSVITNYSQAVSMITARYFGADDMKKVKTVIATAHLTGAVIAAVLMVILLPAAPVILKLLNTPKEIMSAAVLYLRIIFLGIISLMVYNLEAAVLRAVGDSTTPLTAILTATAVNILMDIWLVKGMKLGVCGVAIATVFAQCVSAMVCVFKVYRVKMLRPSRKDWRIDKEIAKECGYLAVPMLVQSFVISFGGFVVQNKVNSYGTVFSGGISASGRVFGLLETSAIALAQAVSIFVSQNRGAGHLERIRQGVATGVVISLLFAFLLCSGMFAFGEEILAFFVSPAEALKYAWDYLIVMSMGLYVMYPMYVLRQSMQALGNAVIPMTGGVIQLLVRVFAALVMTCWLGVGALYLSNIFAWITSLILVCCFFPVQMKQIKTEMLMNGG